MKIKLRIKPSVRSKIDSVSGFVAAKAKATGNVIVNAAKAVSPIEVEVIKSQATEVKHESVNA